MVNTLTRRHLLAGSAAALAMAQCRAIRTATSETGLRDVFPFKLGTAIPTRLMRAGDPQYLDLVGREFSAVTLENAMKWEEIHPEPDTWNFEVADAFVQFAEKHQQYAVGHVLVWHSQVPEAVFKNESGALISRAELLTRMESHIDTLAGRYAGRISAWDVVNEAVDESRGLRLSPWLRGIGEDYLAFAFKFARAADTKAALIYNDYNMHDPQKRAFVVDMVEDLQRRRAAPDAIGMQGHVGLDYTDIKEFEASIKAFKKLGLRVHITEFDVDVLPVAWEFMGAEISTNFEYSDQLNPYADGLPDEVQQRLTERYVEWFKLFLKYRDVIDRVTLWGTSDAESWKNDFPVRGRTNYPLLFDRNYAPKPAYKALLALGPR